MGKKRDGSAQEKWGAGSVWVESPKGRDGYRVAKGRLTSGGLTVRVSVPVKPGRTESAAKKLARSELRRKLTLAQAGTEEADAVHQRGTVAGYVDPWLERKKAEVPDSLPSYRPVAKRIRDGLGGHRLSALAPEHVRGWWRWLAAKGATPAGVHRHAVVLRVFLNDAFSDGYPVPERTRSVKLPKKETTDKIPPTEAQTARLFVATQGDGQWFALWTLLADTGERIGEATGHQWADLDEINGTLRLVRQIDHTTLKPKEIKNPKRRRTIPLALETVAVLTAHRKAEQAAGFGRPGDWLFHSSTGHQLAHSAVQVAFKAALTKAKLPDSFTPHSLRHGHATALQAAGVDLKTISGRLGHSGVGITSRTYVHAVHEQEREAAQRAAKRVRGG